MIQDLILIAILLVVTGGAAYYIYRAKKRGDACIGCPHAKACGGKCSGSCSQERAKCHH